MAIISTRLNTNSCALSSNKFISRAIIFEQGRHRISNSGTLAFYHKNKSATVGTQACVGYRNTLGRLRNSIIDTKRTK
jgi:hypothetical protein